ncbi:hypothetical protein [Amycolatopsis sp. NPDC059657]|uniref:hypothetical protein n=1 Tax=Amycolatopsis sp. NPDC059657 TaxID=3346899 RepID=UPI003671E39F
MRRMLVAAAVLASMLMPGVASAAPICTLAKPTANGVLYKGEVYEFRATGCPARVKAHLAWRLVVDMPLSKDIESNGRGEWYMQYRVDDFSLSMSSAVWVTFDNGVRTNSIDVSIAARP